MRVEESEEVVISGVGGYFPKCSNMEELKNYLFEKEILLESRWKPGERGICNKIGKVPSIEYLDAAYFGIHRQQSTYMDPMQRLVLERTFEALIDAGVNPADIRGKRVGVYMGSSVGENDKLFYESIVSGFGVTGHSRAMMPNRVSYWLNLKGPSCAYDSNWVNGIEVLRLGYEAVRSGQCESAIIGTANLVLNSEISWLYSDLNLLSEDGSVKSFDADANGYARSDGIVVLFLQRASEAKRSYGSIINVAARFNGNREGPLLDLNVNDMVDFMTNFYSSCGVDPRNVDFIETYGAAIKRIDETEMQSLEKVYCKDRKKPLMIGCIKPNTGHSEASSALFGVVKMIISMDSSEIPATIQHTKPNPNIKSLMDGTVKMVTENTKWNGGYGAVNAIGLDSYYGHLLLKSNPRIKVEKTDDLPRLVIASTRTEVGIKEILNTITSKSKVDPEYVALIQGIYRKPINGHLFRGYAVLDKDIKQESEFHAGNKRQIWFVYSGMGSQWCGMANTLMKLPIFANSINKCHKILLPKGLDLLKIITGDDAKIFDNILHSFVGIAAIQIALTDVLRALDIVPDGIIGHSVGELGCAYADGCLTDEQMILAAYSRGKASLEAELIKGMMAAVGMGYQKIKDKCPPTIEIACHNGPDSSTISGPTADMEVFVKQLQDEGVFARLVNVSNIAYHSRYIKPAAPNLLKYLQQVIPKPVPRSPKWISTSIPENQWESDLAKTSSAEYHTNNLLNSVLFEEGLKHIPKESVLIEIAPHGLLQAILKRSLKPGCTNIALTQRGHKDGLNFLLSSIGKIYLAGVDINAAAIFPPITYPVSRGTAGLANLAHWEHSEIWHTGLEDKQNYLVTVKDIQVTLNSEDFRDSVGHQLDDRIILPTASYLLIILKILSTSLNKEIKNVIFENLLIKKILTIPKIGSVPLHAMIQKGSGGFEILSGEDIVFTGKITLPAPNESFLKEVKKIDVSQDAMHLSGNDVYSEFQHRGHKYSGLYKSIKSLALTEDGSISTIQWNNKWTTFLETMIQQYLLPVGEREQSMVTPRYIQRIAFSLPLLPTEKTELEVIYNYSTGIISTEGMEVTGIKANPLMPEPKLISYDSVEFIQLNNVVYKKIENVISIALHIILDNFQSHIINSVTVTEVETENQSLLTNIKNVFNEYNELNSNISSVKDAKLVLIPSNDPFLLVFNNTLRDDIVKVVSSSNGFILARSSKSILAYPQLVQVGQFVLNNISYSLLRKCDSVNVKVVRIKSDTLSAKDISKSNLTWVAEFNNALDSIKGKQDRIYLVASILPSEGIRNFVEELLASLKMSSVRFVFVLDKKAPEFNVNDPTYLQLLKQDLVLVVTKDGNVGTYIPLPVKFQDNVLNTLQISSNQIENKTIHYVGVNLYDETLTPFTKLKSQLGNLDYYAVVNNTGQRIMGLGRIDKDTFKIVADPVLNWTVPEGWTDKEAATIPHAYCSAYYILIQKANLKPGETVLIHAGCSPVGFAAITIAAAMNCTIYTTVATESQRAYLKNCFSFLRDRQILSSESTSFEPYLLMSTGGVGAHVIINTLSGSLLQASARCVADYGRFIQLGKFDRDENNSIGMSLFLRNISLYGVNLESIFEATDESKRELHKLLQDGIDNSAVRPLSHKIVEHQQIEEILNSMRKSDNIKKIIIKITNNLVLGKYNINKPKQFICDGKSSYLVYGGSAEAWADVVEWLILRGARKIIVSSEARPQQTHINRRLTLLQNYFNADIIFAPSKAQTRDGAAELLSEVYFLGPIHAIFLLPNKGGVSKISDIKPVQYIDAALRTIAPKALFINFISSAAGLCQQRAEAGFSTNCIQWASSLEFTDALASIDEILTFKVKNILLKNDKLLDLNQETTQALFKKLTLLLPNNPENLTKQMKYAPETPKLVQLPSLGPRVMRELPPVFIIPGLPKDDVPKQLARQLLYPTFCAVLPSISIPLTEMAIDFAKQMKSVYPTGPYNIVGISWGGALAIEIAKVLETGGGETQIYFIDGSPDTIKAAIKYLGEGVNAEINLLTRIFNISNNELIKTLGGLPDWQSRVKLILNNYDCESGDAEVLEKGLTVVKKRLEFLNNYQPSEELVAGRIHLFRPTESSKYDNCGLIKYCKQTAGIHVIQGDHLSVLKNKICTDIINEKVVMR